MSVKEAFENFWRRRMGGGDGPDDRNRQAFAPELDIYDANGVATPARVERSLLTCRERISALKQRLREEEYIEEFLFDVLRDRCSLFGNMDPAEEDDIYSRQEISRLEKRKTVFPSNGPNVEKPTLASRKPYSIAARRQQFEEICKMQSTADANESAGIAAKKAPKSAAPLPKNVLLKSSAALVSAHATTTTESTDDNSENEGLSRPTPINVDLASSSGKEKENEKTPRSSAESNGTKDSSSSVGDVPTTERKSRESDPSRSSSERTAETTSGGRDAKTTERRSDDDDVAKRGPDKIAVVNDAEIVAVLDKKEIVAVPDKKEIVNGDGRATDGVSPTASVRRQRRRNNYEEAAIVNVENVKDEESSDDEVSQEVLNLLILRQSVCLANKWCEGADTSRARLEEQAQRLSRRFTNSKTLTLEVGGRPQGLDAVAESPSSPRTPSGTSMVDGDQMGGSDSDWLMVNPSLFGRVTDPSYQHDTGGGQLVPMEMRGWVVASLLESEQSYMETLDSLMGHMQMLKNSAGSPNAVVTMTDVEVIFFRISELHKSHYQFVRDLEPKVAKWSLDQQIAEEFKVLAMNEYDIAPEYLRNYSKALATIHSCRQASLKFDELTKDMTCKGSKEKTTLEDMLHKPIVRFQRNTLLLHDLIKYTPTSHSDYDLLQKTLKFARRFLDDLESKEVNKDSQDSQRYLAKNGLIVEKVNKRRKLRHVFLFNDIIVGAKQKPSNRTRTQFEVKWFVPLTDLSLEDKIGLKEDKYLEEDHKEEVETLQRKISELQVEHRSEMKKAKTAAEASKIKMRNRVTNKNVEKIRKKLMEMEAALVIASPNLVFRLYNPRAQKHQVLMMSSDYERTDWKDAITGLLFKAPAPAHLSAIEVQNLVNKQKLMNMKSTGVGLDKDSIYMEDERLYGSLHVRVCKLDGQENPTNAFCSIELDSFGHFTMKAKTNVVSQSLEPVWNEDFEIDLDGAQTLRILCYNRTKEMDLLTGKGALELRSVWLKDGAKEECTISVSNQMSVTISLQYTSRENIIPRCVSTFMDGLFGINLEVITEREKAAVPLLVTSCVQEIEKRGFLEEGLYRVSGLFDMVQLLKAAFEKNSCQATSQLKDADVNTLTGLIKLFFRNLPESLFTDGLYKNFQEGIGLADPDARDKCLLSLFGTLPEPNFATAVFVLDHLVRVSKYEEKNKMTLKNLATVFGPTLLRPANRNSQTQTMEQLFFLSAHEAMMQTTILLHFLNLRANGVEFTRGPSTFL